MAICGCLWEEKKEMWDKVKIDRELRKMLKIHEEILLTVNFHSKHNEVSVNWTTQRCTCGTTSKGDTRHLMTSSKCYLKKHFKKEIL